MSRSKTRLVADFLGKIKADPTTGEVISSAEEYTDQVISELVGDSPTTLDTLEELSTNKVDKINITGDTVGSASQVPVITFNEQGQITSATETAVAGVSSTSYDASTGVITINTSDGGSHTADLGVGTADSPTFADVTLGTSTSTVSETLDDKVDKINVTGATVGSASQVPVITYNAQGQITSATTTNVAGVSSFSYDGTTEQLTITTADGGSYSVDVSSLASESFVNGVVANLVDSAPVTLDTLNELAAALGDDPNFATTVSNSIGTKAAKTTTVSAGTALTGGGDLSANRTISHASVSRSNTTDAGSLAHSGTFTAITGVTTNTQGHVTGAETTTYTLPAGYSHPSYAGDDINLDTGPLSGATVISDLDFNVTTDTLGHVTDANATYATRTLTAADIGAQPAGNYVLRTGDTMTGRLVFPDAGYSIGNEYHTWKRSYSINNTSPANLLYHDGTALDAGGVYRFHAHIAGTGTDQSATAVFWNQNGTWKVNVTYQSGTSSNHPEFIIGGSPEAPQIHIDHPSNYTVEVLGERLELSEGTGTDNQSGFGTDAFLGSVGGILRYNNGGTANTYDQGYKVFHDGYHPNADKWTTTRTLSLSGDASGSVSWDGSANATLSVTVNDDSHNHTIANIDGLQTALDGKAAASHSHSYLPLTGGTLTGNIMMNDEYIDFKTSGNPALPQIRGFRGTTDLNTRLLESEGGFAWTTYDSSTANKPSGTTNNANGVLSLNTHGGAYGHQLAFTNSGGFWHRSEEAGSVRSWDRVFTDTYHPNADKWTTARTLSLTGDVTGSTSWDGSGNASITATVSNDSHSHSNYITSNAADTATGRVQFSANQANNWDTIATATGSQGSIEVYNSGSGNDAFMCFHAGGDFALYFGLDADSNDLAVGGWSMGAVKHKVWHAGNDGSGSGLDADLLDGINASSFLRSDTDDTLTGNLQINSHVINMDLNNVNDNAIEMVDVRSSTWPFEFNTNAVGNDNPSGFWVGPNGYPDMRLRRENGTVRALISSWERSYTSYGFTDTQDIRSPLFYDNNDTSYYLNPNGMSRLNRLSLGVGSYTSLMQYGAMSIGDVSTNYKYTGGWSSSMQGGILANCADNWEFVIHDSGHALASPFCYNGGASGRNFEIGRDLGWGNMYTTIHQSTRTPIVYDSNNTGYYSDPAGTSNFNAVNVNSLAIGGTVTANTPFFVNPNTITANYTVPTNYNAMSAGPITINSGVTVTVPTGSAWSIV